MSQIDPSNKEMKTVTDNKESLVVQPEGSNILKQVPTDALEKGNIEDGEASGQLITILDTDYDKYMVFGNCFSEDIAAAEDHDAQTFHRYTVAVFVRDPENAKDIEHYKELAQKAAPVPVKMDDYAIIYKGKDTCEHVKDGKSIFELPDSVTSDFLSELFEKAQAAGGGPADDGQVGEDVQMPQSEEEFIAYVKETEGREPSKEEIEEYMKVMQEQGHLNEGNTDQALAQEMPQNEEEYTKYMRETEGREPTKDELEEFMSFLEGGGQEYINEKGVPTTEQEFKDFMQATKKRDPTDQEMKEFLEEVAASEKTLVNEL